MLKKRDRLTKKEFERYFSSGKRLHSPLLQLIYTKGDAFHGAVVVGKKVHKKAVDRNTLRRRLYSILYNHMKEEALSGVHIIIAKPAARGVSYKVLKEDVFELVGRTR